LGIALDIQNIWCSAVQELSHVEQELAENADAIRRMADAVEPKMRAFEDADKDHKVLIDRTCPRNILLRDMAVGVLEEAIICCSG